MRELFFILLILLIIYGCKSNNDNDKIVGLTIVNNTNIDFSGFYEIDCLDELSNKNIRDVRIEKLIPPKNNSSDKNVKLTIQNIDTNNLWYNIEVYRFSNSDTIRVANFGGREIEKINATIEIKETLCQFLNK